jgi:hypothetical protein
MIEEIWRNLPARFRWFVPETKAGRGGAADDFFRNLVSVSFTL